MVYGPGGYRVGDLWKLGLVVLIWTLIVTVVATPLSTGNSAAGWGGCTDSTQL